MANVNADATLALTLTCRTCGTTWVPDNWHHTSTYGKDGACNEGLAFIDVTLKKFACPACDAAERVIEGFRAHQRRMRDY